MRDYTAIHVHLTEIWFLSILFTPKIYLNTMFRMDEKIMLNWPIFADADIVPTQYR